jgi:hypothetical protein
LNFSKLSESLGVPLKREKTVRPCTTLTFVGIELDSIEMEKRLPLDKLTKIKQLLKEFSVRKKVTLKELQSLIGVLSFACSVVTPGRPFLRRLIDLTLGLKQPHHKRRLNKEAKADLAAWSVFVDSFNGKSLFISDKLESSETLNLFTDASNLGCGGYLGSKWFAQEWPPDWTHHHINTKEMFPITVAVELWGNILQNKSITFHTDNLTVMHIINKQSSTDKNIMHLVRRLVVACLSFNISFQARYIPGLQNILADKLSRLQIREFVHLCPFKDLTRQEIPTGKYKL